MAADLAIIHPMADKGKRKPHDVSLFPAPNTVTSQHYYYVTQRPWPSLLFILPMLLFTELMTYFRHRNGQGSSELVATWLVERTIDEVVRSFGGSGFYSYLPGLLTVATLLAWHIAARHAWRIDLSVFPGMLGESLVWTLPLFVFHRVLHQAVLAGSSQAQTAWLDAIVSSMGAGIYEELVFRLICITILVIVLIDLCRLPRTPAAVLIMLSSAVLFAVQHNPPLGAEPFETVRFLFRTAAGLYLAGLFIFRGFGVAAGCHAFYNVIVVTIAAVS